MTARSFVHLHCHTHYSLLDGANRIPELVKHTKSLGMSALAITDHGNLYGAIEFYNECKKVGINPIVGYEAYVAPSARTAREAKKRGEAGFHLTLLAKNATGFYNLVKLASIAFLEGYYYVPRIDKEVLSAHKEGLICLSGCASGEFSELLLQDRKEEAEKLAVWFQQTFANDFYVEIQNNGLRIQRECAQAASDLANRMGLPLVATSDAHYLKQEDAAAHDVLLCINTGRLLKDPQRMRYGEDNKLVDQFFIRNPEEMYALFPNQAEAVQRSQEIANGVCIELDFKKRHFPVFAPPEGKTPEEYLRELCVQGLQERYGENPSQLARDRLEHELGIILRMGFSSYFLIVWDFVRFAREAGIPAGARGSACGAVVSYVLYLSHVCPIEYDLLFERFLDPNRNEAPDIDIDFCQERREEVIAYVKRKYGEASVAQIATFGTMAARAAIKDVGRVMDVPLERVVQLTNMVPKTLNITLEDALQESSELRQAYQNDPDVKQLIEIARKLEGTNRNSGTHAAGVVISNGPLSNYVPLQRVVRRDEAGNKGDEPVITTQWVMDDIAQVGLLKMDFLGLRTLTLVENTVALIKKTRNLDINVQSLPLDDGPTFALLQRGQTQGVFQFESEGIRELLKRMKPDSIRDIIASTALYRPGPLKGGMDQLYVNRKHGREPVVYQHEIMKAVLEETYGIMVYQEQVMRILNRLGGIELSSAYACIKAISKKKQEIIDERRVDFLKGALERGVQESVAQEIFELITYFGEYGFNKSHSAAYALVSYQTAYLKQHYTAEFMAALLSSEVDDSNKRDILVDHINDARKLGVEVLPPDINLGDVDFTVSKGRIVFGLTALKGLGRASAAEIVRARTEGGKFVDLFDFCDRVDPRLVPRAVIERLIKAGAFDSMARRSQMMIVLPHALQAALERQADRKLGQKNLFEEDEVTANEGAPSPRKSEPLPDLPEWPNSEKLKFEKEVLDFYFSSHPLAEHDGTLQRFSTHGAGHLAQANEGQEVIVGGILVQIRFKNTKSARNGNSQMVRCKIEDFSGSAECLMWPDDLVKHKQEFIEDRVCFVKGTIDKRNREQPVLLLNRVLSLEQAQRELTKGLWLQLSNQQHTERDVEALGNILRRSAGTCPVYLLVKDKGGRKVTLRLGHEFRINPATLSINDLETMLGLGSVKFAGPASVNGPTRQRR